jgi:methionine sulfoxide reductase heme-binding subunit
MTQRPDPADHVWWLISRSAGVVAFALVALSVLLGLGMATRTLRGPGVTKVVMAVHEHTAVAGLIAIAVHGIALLGDAFLRPAPIELAVPFLIDYRPAAVAAGIAGGWLAALLGLTFYVRRRLGPKRWRAAHRATVLVYVLAVVHTLTAGTDASTAWLRAIVWGTAAPIAVLLAARLLGGVSAAARGSASSGSAAPSRPPRATPGAPAPSAGPAPGR